MLDSVQLIGNGNDANDNYDGAGIVETNPTTIVTLILWECEEVALDWMDIKIQKLWLNQMMPGNGNGNGNGNNNSEAGATAALIPVPTLEATVPVRGP